MIRKHILFLSRYGISGLVGIPIPIAFLYVWVSLLGLEKSYLIGLLFGFILALITTFILQKYWSFRDSEPGGVPRQLFSYSVVAVLGLVLNAVLLIGAKILIESLSLDFFQGWYLIAQTVIIGIVAVFNFSLNFIFTFRHARRKRLWHH